MNTSTNDGKNLNDKKKNHCHWKVDGHLRQVHTIVSDLDVSAAVIKVRQPFRPWKEFGVFAQPLLKADSDSESEPASPIRKNEDEEEQNKKLKLPSLMELAERKLCDIVSIRNVVDALYIAEFYHAQILRAYCLRFTALNWPILTTLACPDILQIRKEDLECLRRDCFDNNIR